MLGKKEYPTVAMVVSNDLVSDRRVARHAEALAEEGYRVVVIGRLLPESKEAAVGCEVVRMPLKHRRGWRFYAEYNRRVVGEICREEPDIVWANDTDTLLGAYRAAHRMRKPLVLDAHELFPEVPEIRHKPLVRFVWRSIERMLMPRCAARLTVCRGIADYYAERYGLSMEVVRNMGVQSVDTSSPQEEALEALLPPSPLHTLLYQGCINVGRGVDWAIDALEWLDDCRLVVVGGGDLALSMRQYAASKPWKERVLFLGSVPPQRLDGLSRQAEVGLVMLEDMGLSYHFALPNRVGDFIAAGVPMVVSDLPEMAAVVRRHGVGEVMQAPGPKPLAEAVRRILERGRPAYDFSSAREDFCWQTEKKRLVEIVQKLCPSASAENMRGENEERNKTEIKLT